MSVNGKHGVTASTPENILLGAGTIHRGLTVGEDGKISDYGSIIGATAGGNSVEIKGEVYTIELDGAMVKVKGLAVMQGGTATMECNFAEMSEEVITMGMIGKAENGVITPKANIEEGDYVSGFAFVGKTANDAKEIVVVFENALCTSGFKIEGKAKENSVIALTMEAYADNAGNLDVLPIKVIYV